MSARQGWSVFIVVAALCALLMCFGSILCACSANPKASSRVAPRAEPPPPVAARVEPTEPASVPEEPVCVDGVCYAPGTALPVRPSAEAGATRHKPESSAEAGSAIGGDVGSSPTRAPLHPVEVEEFGGVGAQADDVPPPQQPTPREKAPPWWGYLLAALFAVLVVYGAVLVALDVASFFRRSHA